MIKFIFCILYLLVSTYSWCQSLYKERYRPQFHFTPERNWINDPNGLVYHNGQYHMFYQHNPFGNLWGHMSWGHAVSNDLVHWRHLPVAIYEQDSFMIFSGSAVIDKNSSSGFGKGNNSAPMVAVYTAHVIRNWARPNDYTQEQHVAYSLNNGRTFTIYGNNPVLDIGEKDFRDPKVFWHDASQQWIMLCVLAKEHTIKFYRSSDLKTWTHISDFGPAGDTLDIWECSDLLQVPVENTNESKWVLINSQQYTVQYFVGDFDGTKFTNQNPPGIYRQDYGPDYYAVITYNNLPKGRKPVSIGWANNWSYARAIPTFPWRSAMSLPRELTLKRQDNEWVLLSNPVQSLQKLRGKMYAWNGLVSGERRLPVTSQTVEIDLSLEVSRETSGVKIAVGQQNEFIIGFDGSTNQLFIDRSKSGQRDFHPDFARSSKYSAAMKPTSGKIRLRIFFDKSIVEVYGNDGEVVLTAQTFPSEQENGIVLFSSGNTNADVRIWKLSSTW